MHRPFCQSSSPSRQLLRDRGNGVPLWSPSHLSGTAPLLMVPLLMIANPLQFHEVSASVAGYWQTAHNDDVFAALHKLLILQTLIYDGDQFFRRALHLNAMR